MSTLPRIAISIGDPAGVGAEITLTALGDPAIAGLAHWLLIGDEAALAPAARLANIPLTSLPCEFVPANALPRDHTLAFGQLRAEYGLAAIEYVRRTVEL